MSFREVKAEELTMNPFTKIGKEWPVITLGINLIQALDMFDGAGKIPCSINRDFKIKNPSKFN